MSYIRRLVWVKNWHSPPGLRHELSSLPGLRQELPSSPGPRHELSSLPGPRQELSLQPGSRHELSLSPGLTHELFSTAQIQRSRVWIPIEAWMSVCVYSVFVFSCIQIETLRWADPLIQEVLPTAYRIERLKSGQDLAIGCRAIGIQYFRAVN
jgi:hypothetical protein